MLQCLRVKRLFNLDARLSTEHRLSNHANPEVEWLKLESLRVDGEWQALYTAPSIDTAFNTVNELVSPSALTHSEA